MMMVYGVVQANGHGIERSGVLTNRDIMKMDMYDRFH